MFDEAEVACCLEQSEPSQRSLRGSEACMPAAKQPVAEINI